MQLRNAALVEGSMAKLEIAGVEYYWSKLGDNLIDDWGAMQLRKAGWQNVELLNLGSCCLTQNPTNFRGRA